MQYVSIYMKFNRDADLSGETLKKITGMGILKVRRLLTWSGEGTGQGGLLAGDGFVLFLILGDWYMNVCIF